jgi:hypothetical protein
MRNMLIFLEEWALRDIICEKNYNLARLLLIL